VDVDHLQLVGRHLNRFAAVMRLGSGSAAHVVNVSPSATSTATDIVLVMVFIFLVHPASSWVEP